MTAIYLYPSLCLFEGTMVSVGRGTDKPFEVFGYPTYRKGPSSFTPISKIGALHPLYENTLCWGYDLSVYNTGYFVKRKSVIIDWLMQMYFNCPDRKSFFGDYFDKLAGTDKLRTDIQSLQPQMMIIHSWLPGILQFKKIRSKYLLYTDFE